MILFAVATLFGLLILGFLTSPLWMHRGQTSAAYSRELIDRIGEEIEQEIRALRTYSDKQA